jgi:hypothetical protein
MPSVSLRLAATRNLSFESSALGWFCLRPPFANNQQFGFVEMIFPPFKLLPTKIENSLYPPRRISGGMFAADCCRTLSL